MWLPIVGRPHGLAVYIPIYNKVAPKVSGHLIVIVITSLEYSYFTVTLTVTVLLSLSVITTCVVPALTPFMVTVLSFTVAVAVAASLEVTA